MGMATVQLITFSVAEIINVAELGCIGTGLNFLSTHTDIIIRTQLLDKSEILQFSNCCYMCKYFLGSDVKSNAQVWFSI